MGNWRRVNVVGTCDESEVPRLRGLIGVPFGDGRWDCMCGGGICGLPNWGDRTFDAVGNLAERDYGPDSVKNHLEALAKECPSLTVKVHCGSDWEESPCIATVTLADGKSTVGTPEIKNVRDTPADQMQGHMLQQLVRPPR